MSLLFLFIASPQVQSQQIHNQQRWERSPGDLQENHEEPNGVKDGRFTKDSHQAHKEGTPAEGKEKEREWVYHKEQRADYVFVRFSEEEVSSANTALSDTWNTSRHDTFVMSNISSIQLVVVCSVANMLVAIREVAECPLLDGICNSNIGSIVEGRWSCLFFYFTFHVFWNSVWSNDSSSSYRCQKESQ